MKYSENSLGIAAMLAAVGSFSLMDAVMKSLTDSYPPMQVAALRGLSAMPLVCAYVLWRREVPQLLQVRWPLHLFRGVIGVAMLYLFAYGVQRLTLTDAYAISFIAPLIITILAVPFLKEKVHLRHWICLFGGLVGVLVAMRPSADTMLSMGALAVLGCACCYAASAVAGRILTRTDTSSSLVFWMTLLLGLGAGVLAAPDWVAIQPKHWLLIVALAVTGFLGQLTITQAFRYGQASVVAPLEYTALIWGAGLDWFIWRTLPGASTLLGALIIIGCGLYLIRHSRNPAVLVATPP
jgi:drug/metabolite transporter (DMT)-like permease